MQRTKIEYLTHSWSPLAMRCTPVSEGCQNCWHIAMAKRLAGNHLIDRDAQRAYAGIDGPSMNFVELEAPLHLRKPSRIGVQFMGDLFHENVLFSTIARIFRAMIEANNHIYLLLTKRLDRALDFDDWSENQLHNCIISPWQDHIWLGVSIENQARAGERIPVLLQTPASKRFVSVEPMLSQINISEYLVDQDEGFRPGLDWVICGGETGPKARPMHPDWVRSIRDQCQAAGVPFFFKGWGEWVTYKNWNNIGPNPRVVRVGKKVAGRLLDGREWNEMPWKEEK